MLSCSIWFSAPSFWMGGGLESSCVSRVYGADGAVHHPHTTLFREEDARSNSLQVSDIRNLHTTLSFVCDFHENRYREGINITSAVK